MKKTDKIIIWAVALSWIVGILRTAGIVFLESYDEYLPVSEMIVDAYLLSA